MLRAKRVMIPTSIDISNTNNTGSRRLLKKLCIKKISEVNIINNLNVLVQKLFTNKVKINENT